MSALLGCIADDFTGATDMAGTLTRAGMRTVQMIGVPNSQPALGEVDAIVIALKSRTIAKDQAISQSIDALNWLKSAGCRQIVFKYCSTFDSTDEGNIGQVSTALLDALEDDFTIVCPAFPRNGRLVFKGYLFVGDALLNESGMQDHPITPMTDPNLLRVLGRQIQGSVGLVDYQIIKQGPAAVQAEFERLRTAGIRMAIVDTLDDADLDTIAFAARDLKLITGGSGIGSGLAENFRRSGLLPKNNKAASLPKIAKGGAAILAGSCSRATQAQIAYAQKHYASFKIDPLAFANKEQSVTEVTQWAIEQLASGPILIYSSASPQVLAQVHKKLGKDQSGLIVEQALSALAVLLLEQGVNRLVVAGGETSGAVVKALGIRGLRIGQEISPGVPWTQTIDEPTTSLALKSGNFGEDNFFISALEKCHNND